MLKKWYQKAWPKELDIRERMFRMIVLVGSVLAFAGTMQCLFLVETKVIVVPLLVYLCAMIAAGIATYKYRMIEFSAVLVGIMLIAVVFPAMFFLSGGIEGGAAVWFVLEIFYIIMMFSGRRMVFFLFLSLSLNAVFYEIGYRFPQYVRQLDTRADVFFDSYFSVVMVGIAGGVLLKFQMKIFNSQRAITLEQKEELEKASKSKNVFFASMSHEIRTPINAISGLNEMILRESKEPGTQEYARNIQSVTKMLLNLVNDILDLSKLEVKKMEIIAAEYSTQTLFEDLIDMIQVRMQEKKLDFYVDIDENIPAVLIGDERRIKQVILNILTNAVKYTETGSVTLTARSENMEEGKIKLEVSVADTGIGIRKEDLEYLYDSFRRMDEKKNASIEGSGLGMSIVKQLMDLMGGEISVDSIYKKGSVFTISLEQEAADRFPIGKVNFRGNGRDYQRYTYRQSFEAPEARILIVDDNELNAKVASSLLKATRVQVDTAKSGTECLMKTKQRYYHVILMDYMMPEMNGVETLRALRRQENGLCRESPVIVMTANALSDARELYEENGFDSYLEKPVQSGKLEAEILNFLPDEIIAYRESPSNIVGAKHEIQKISGRKRKNIYITTDCVCDLPEELLDRFDIKLMYLYIKTDQGRFADTREIDSDNLPWYLSESSSEAYADSVSVEEYEAFFAEMLSQADHVIHISMASGAGKSYGIAMAAAAGFNHVHVIDSGQISCGEGMVALYAARLMMEGHRTQEICELIERMKQNVMTTFFLPGIEIFYKNGYVGKLTKLCFEQLRLHPIVGMHQSRLILRGAQFGNLEGAWKRHIHAFFRKKRRINTDIVIITHAGCSVSQQEMIREEVLKCVPFERVIIQKASFSVACNAGVNAIGISYYLN